MNFSTPLQNKPQPATVAEAAPSDQLGSFNLSRSAIADLDPYANLNRIASQAPINLSNSSMPLPARAAAVGPLTIERAIEPTFEVVVLPQGTELRFSPADIRPDFGRRPDLSEIRVNGNQIVLESATAMTTNGDGTLRAQNSFKAVIPEAEITFPGEKSVVRFNRLPVTVQEGAIVRQGDYSLAA